jgi:glycosyltransferase involved in cell wall biosynthesis
MMVSDPLVTIVIPVYNGANFLAEAIDSALAQNYPNTEIVVVNDGSSDGGMTERIAQSYGPQIRYFSKANGGVASALNLAISEMKGEYFSWLSHDDLYVPGKVAREMEVLLGRVDRRTIVYSDYSVFGRSVEAQDIRLQTVSPERFRYWITVENRLHGGTLLIPKVAFDECGTFDESLRTTQDYDLWFRMAMKFCFVHLSEVLVKARNHPDQGSVKLAGTALAECDILLKGFVNGLSRDEVMLGSQSNPVTAYAMIARRMSRRGFRNASRRAISLSLECFAAASVSEKLFAALSLARVGAIGLAGGGVLSSVLKIFRRVVRATLPSRAWEAIRRDLHSSDAKASSSSVDSVRNLSLKEKFAQVYVKNIFGGADSRSGAGSDLQQTAIIRREIPRLLRERSVRSMLDAPCGDWFWIREVDLGIGKYVGADIVEALIEANQSRFGREGIDFVCLDLSKDKLPMVDLIFSRDCLVHLSFEDASRMLRNFKSSGATYLLTTTFSSDRSMTIWEVVSGVH